MRTQRNGHRTILAGLAGALAAAQAAAHPGHGARGGDFSLAHYLTEPLHVVTTVLCILAVAGALAWARRASRRV
jgi:hypothetical protein